MMSDFSFFCRNLHSSITSVEISGKIPVSCAGYMRIAATSSPAVCGFRNCNRASYQRNLVVIQVLARVIEFFIKEQWCGCEVMR